MFFYRKLFISLLLFSLCIVFAQTSNYGTNTNILPMADDLFPASQQNNISPDEINDAEQKLLENEKNGEASFVKPQVLPNKKISGWLNISFDDDNAAVIEKLTNQYSWIEFDNEIFIEGLEENKNKRLLKTFENAIFKQLEFQFDDEEKLYLIRMQLSPRFFSFLDIVKSLQKKYGKEDVITARKLMWVGDKGVLELYRDLLIKYIKKDVRFPSPTAEAPEESFLEEEKKKLTTNIIDGL